MTFRFALCLLLALFLTTAQAGWGFGAQRGGQGQNQNNNQNRGLNITEATQLSFLREEEKMARDVYRHHYRLWGLPAFGNISEAEQRHMDAVLSRLEQYGLIDPALDQEAVFSNGELQGLYDSLSAQGEISLIEALMSGALIEEVDMQDLDEMIGDTDKEDLISLYETLHCGSRNHLRAFVRQIENRGRVYTAQILSQEAVDAIVDSPMERRCGATY